MKEVFKGGLKPEDTKDKKYTWECSATSLAASIAATAAIAYTMWKQ